MVEPDSLISNKPRKNPMALIALNFQRRRDANFRLFAATS
jgi:hypothetical protein